MTPPDVWVPVPLRWRHVVPGDVVLGKDGRLWHVMNFDRGQVHAVHTKDDLVVSVDPDTPATVLVPATERDALHLTRAELGAQVESRRLNQEPGAA